MDILFPFADSQDFLTGEASCLTVEQDAPPVTYQALGHWTLDFGLFSLKTCVA